VPPPPAPWDCTLDAVVWFHRAAPNATEQLLPELRQRRTIPITIGALISYRDTPVGPYDEVLGSPVLLAEWPLPASSIPFIAVDSSESVDGGRTNWQLPKTLARFEWPHRAEGDDWSVQARVRSRRRAFPLAGSIRTRQNPQTTFTTRAHAHARLGSVDIETRGQSLPGWLRSGRHPALVLQDARVTVGAPG
jgi:Acetoacetate decarboxylase (ADC)